MLINNIAEVKNILPIGAGNDFNRLKPHFRNAENRYIKPLIGTDMYTEIDNFRKAVFEGSSGADNEFYAALLEKLQTAIVHLAYFIGFDFLNVSVTDAGINRIEGQNTKTLYKYQEDNLKRYFADSGFNGLDDALVYLEDNIEKFTAFADSENWKQLRKSFFPTVRTVEQVPFSIGNSRLVLLALVPKLAYIEQTTIRNVIGSENLDLVKSEMEKNEPAEKVTAILPYIRRPLIYLAASMLMEDTGAELGDKGLFFSEINPTSPDNRVIKPSESDKADAMALRYRSLALNYIEQLKTYMAASTSDWPGYQSSGGRLHNRSNSGKKTFWA